MSKTRQAVLLGLGAWLCGAFFGLAQTQTGLTIAFFPPWTRSSAGELMGWLGFTMLLVPGAGLLGLAMPKRLGDAFSRAASWLDQRNRKEWQAGLMLIFLLAFFLALAGRWILFRGLPVTDDEYAARFGGQVLALNKTAVPVFPAFRHFPRPYLFLRDGLVTSFDWLGVQLAWALAEISGSGTTIFSLAAAIPAAAVAYIAEKKWGPRWALVAALLFITSPMSMLLSWSAHAHLLSRAMLAIAIAIVAAEEHDRPESAKRWAAWGLAWGFSFLCRPVETAALGSPLLLGALNDARKNKQTSHALAPLVAGAALPLLLFALHNAAVTGHPWLPARFAANELTMPSWKRPWESAQDVQLFWERFGSNGGYNTFRLMLWFWGPIGAILAFVGASQSRFNRRLAAGVVLLLLVGLSHDDPGSHVVGPIHQSETVVPLTLLATSGLARTVDWLRNKGITARPLLLSVLAVACIAMPIFGLHHGLAVRRMTAVQEDVYGMLEQQAKAPAVVLAPRFYRIWTSADPYRKTGSWVLNWRYAKPQLDDPVLILHDGKNAVESVKKAFPKRKLYRLASQPAKDGQSLAWQLRAVP